MRVHNKAHHCHYRFSLCSGALGLTLEVVGSGSLEVQVLKFSTMLGQGEERTLPVGMSSPGDGCREMESIFGICGGKVSLISGVEHNYILLVLDSLTHVDTTIFV